MVVLKLHFAYNGLESMKSSWLGRMVLQGYRGRDAKCSQSFDLKQTRLPC